MTRSHKSTSSAKCAPNFNFRAPHATSSFGLPTSSMLPSLGNLDTPSSFGSTSDYWGAPKASVACSSQASPHHVRQKGQLRQERAAIPQSSCSSRTDGHVHQLRQQSAIEKVSNPRRASISQGAPREVVTPLVPSLVRQCDRKSDFVDNLVDFAARTVAAIWPDSDDSLATSEPRHFNLRTFIQETLRRSRTSYSTMQVALYYLIVVKEHVPRSGVSDNCATENPAHHRALQSGRRMFLAALILASKYLQDRNYSARAWSRISGLPIPEINTNEMAFLTAVNWKLHLSETLFNRWIHVVLTSVSAPLSLLYPEVRANFEGKTFDWAMFVTILTPSLENVHVPIENEFESPSDSDMLSPLATAGADNMFEGYPSSRRSSISHSPTAKRGGLASMSVAPSLKSVLPPPRPLEPPTMRSQGALGMSLAPASMSSERLIVKSSAMGSVMGAVQNAAFSGCATENWGFIARSETPSLTVTSPTSQSSSQSQGPPRRSSLSVCSSASSPDSVFSQASRSSSISSSSSASGAFCAAYRRAKMTVQCESQRLNPLQRIVCTTSDQPARALTSFSEHQHMNGCSFAPVQRVSPTATKSLFSGNWTSSKMSETSSPGSDVTPKGTKGRKRSRNNLDPFMPTPSPTFSLLSTASTSSSPGLYQSLSSSTVSLLAPPSMASNGLGSSALLSEVSSMDICVSPQDYTGLTTGMTPQIQMQLQLQTPHLPAPIMNQYGSGMMSPDSFRESKRTCCGVEEGSTFPHLGHALREDLALSSM